MLPIFNIDYSEKEIQDIMAGRRPIIQAMSDNDLYKFTMQQGIFLGGFADGSKSYGDLNVEYKFKDRRGTAYPKGFATAVMRQVQLMANLTLTDFEYRKFSELPYMKRTYLDFLRGYRYDPNEVQVKQRGGKLTISIRGAWYRTVLWEVPLLAIVSELYFHMTGQKPNVKIFEKHLRAKTELFASSALALIEFGTRRRVSFRAQEAAVVYLKHAHPRFLGTSNVWLAFKHGVKVYGTHAHEWFMAHQAMYGTRLANKTGLESWARVYNGLLGMALTDTFTTEDFFASFDKKLARLFDGVRQDSGDPIIFGEAAIRHYEKLGIDPKSKVIVFSDALNASKAVAIRKHFAGRINMSFGIGTDITNDVGLAPLNIVIKLARCRWMDSERWIDVVKLSDDAGKHTGKKSAVKHTQYELGLR